MVRFRRTLESVPVWKRREVKILLLITAVAAAAYLSVLLLASQNATTLAGAKFLPMHIAIEVFTIAVSFSIFSVRWSARKYAKDARSLFIGSAFLSIGLLHIAHTLSYQGMPSLVEPDVNRPIYFWIAARLTFATTLAVALFLSSSHPSRLIRPKPILASFLIFSVVLIALFTWFIDLFPPLIVTGVGLTELKVALEYVIMGILLAAVLKYWSLMTKTRDSAVAFLMAAMVLAIFEESLFTLYKNVYGLMNLAGHVFGFASFAFIFLALFEASVARPYERLASEERRLAKALGDLAKKKRETDEAIARAQTYMDFLSHDMANIITPVKSYAEMISGDERVPPKIVKYSMGIVNQIDHASSSIVRMRKLSEIVKDLAAGHASNLDLGDAFRSGKTLIEQRNPKRKLNLVLESPARVPISFAGAGSIEDVIVEILDLGARHSIHDAVTVAARISEIEDRKKTPFWHVQVDFSKVYVPENLDLSTTDVFDAAERMRRGVFSDASFLASVLQLLGGEIQAERLVGAESTGTLRIVMQIPRPPVPVPLSGHETDHSLASENNADRVA